MEFSNLGANCSWSECRQLDFLPFQCTHCQSIFCKDHFGAEAHQCSCVTVTEAAADASPKNVQCTFDSCKTKDIIEMLCVKCNNHFCLTHRYHSCFKYSPEEIEKARQKLNQPKEQFEKSLQEVNAIIDAGIERAKKSAKNHQMAMKVQLMRLKGKAVGPPNIPADDRVYFLLFLPLRLKTKSKAVYCSKEWTVGRIIDTVAASCNVANRNNEGNAEKLRLFKKLDGTQLSTNLSVKVSQLLVDGVIVNGESLILEYVPHSDNLNDFAVNATHEYKE